jgi:hypothetical protein
MRTKLKLNLDQLNVDTFTTEIEKRASGTVFGEQCTCYTNCSCPGCPTCDASCNGTCGATCGGSCDYSCGGTCDVYCGGTVNDATCNNYGTCNPGRVCYIVP